MANTILSSLLSSPSLAITSDNSSIDVASNLGVSKVVLKLRARIFKHKQEDGSTIVDARVTEPKIVEIDLFVKTLDDIAMINYARNDRSGTYTIKSRGLVLKRMMMYEGNVKQTSEMISASPVHLVFKELLTQNLTNVGPKVVAQPANSTLIDKGIQTLSEAKQTVTGLADQVKSAAGVAAGSAISQARGALGI